MVHGLEIIRKQNAQAESPQEWRCFHCDQLFTDRQKAAEHFGARPSDMPTCSAWIYDYLRLQRTIEQLLEQLSQKEEASETSETET